MFSCKLKHKQSSVLMVTNLLLHAGEAKLNLTLFVESSGLNSNDIIRVGHVCREVDRKLPDTSTVTATHIQLHSTTVYGSKL